MEITSFIPIIPVLLLSLFILNIFNKTILKIELPKGRNQSIDGLRGYLAIFVFFHHSIVWYFFLKNGYWAFTPSNLYNHLGTTSVGFFFMITSFLFFSKIANSQNRKLNWKQLYIGRVLRILPLYLTICIVVFTIVLIKSNWILIEPIENITKEIIQWISFIQVDINNYADTRIIVARVVWSLAFEWLFYFSLPLFGWLCFRVRASKLTFILSLLLFALYAYIIWNFYPVGAVKRLCPFLGGIAAVFAYKTNSLKELSRSNYLSINIAILILITLFFFRDAYSIVPFLLIVIIFISFALGNSLFGILLHPYSQLLGLISYSIYLLHGILLFTTLNFIPGLKSIVIASPINYWIFISFNCTILVLVSAISYKFIEHPFIVKTSKINQGKKVTLSL
ncbi:acyltransferase family protein [Chitinophaga silvisoli]|uniref:Acyltransferase n=1 Tax=Chitinophaga silvisoli TaxID=2291814 RepID=A0A3E1P3E8_9BACT|nr:acyltransferase [Chitinophaga silvisoli]RFM34687.1 acyltransferase [Chitinophaga silvisoli]